MNNLFLQVHDNDFRPKCIYAAVMLRRMMEAIINKDTLDDKVRRQSLLHQTKPFILTSIILGFYGLWLTCINFHMIHSTFLQQRVFTQMLYSTCVLLELWLHVVKKWIMILSSISKRLIVFLNDSKFHMYEAHSITFPN